jgi:hypothetical protein
VTFLYLIFSKATMSIWKNVGSEHFITRDLPSNLS